MLLVMGSAIQDARGGHQWRHTSPKADHAQVVSQVDGLGAVGGGPSGHLVRMGEAAKTEMCKEAAEFRSKQAALLDALPFRLTVNATILFNAVQMGLAVDLKGEGWDDAWHVCEHFFTAFFLFEMLFKVYALQLRPYFADSWNCFDFCIVWTAVLGAWIMPAAGGSGSTASNVSMLRLLRLLRLLRMAKLLKVFPEFMIVINSVFGAFKSLFWVLLLGLFVLYMFAVACVQLVGGRDAGYPEYSEASSDIDDLATGEFNNYLYFGSMGRSMLSLFSLMLLSEMDVIFRAVYEVQPYMILLFMILMAILTFGLLNVLVGMIVDNVIQAVKRLEEEKQEQLRVQQMDLVKELAKIVFDDIDGDKDGLVSVVEIQKLTEMLDSISLPHGFALEDLHKMLDVDGSGQLSKQEFLDGMFRLVFNTDFQRDCMVQLALGQMKAEQFKMHHALRKEIHASVEALLSEVRLVQTRGPLDGEELHPPTKSRDRLSSASSLSSASRSEGEHAAAAKINGVDGRKPGGDSTAGIGPHLLKSQGQCKDDRRASAVDPCAIIARLSATVGGSLPSESRNKILSCESNGVGDHDNGLKLAKIVPNGHSSMRPKAERPTEANANPVRAEMMKVGCVRQTKPPQLTSGECSANGGAVWTFWPGNKDFVEVDV